MEAAKDDAAEAGFVPPESAGSGKPEGVSPLARTNEVGWCLPLGNPPQTSSPSGRQAGTHRWLQQSSRHLQTHCRRNISLPAGGSHSPRWEVIKL